MLEVLPYFLIPSVVLVFSSLLGQWLTPSVKTRSAMQHLAAGIIFATVATEVVPELLQDGHVATLSIGYVAGMILIFGVRFLDSSEMKRSNANGWIGLAIAASIDLLIDGFLIGVAFSVSKESGILLTIAIAFEVLFLGFTFTISFSNRGLQKRAVFFLLLGIALFVFVGALVGYWVLEVLEPSWKVAAMAFGCVALLYLIAEELLLEAHQTKDNAVAPYLLFIGFGLMLVASMLL